MKSAAVPVLDASRWPRIKEAVAGALELPPPRRAAFLDQADLSPTDRRRVETLLAAYDADPDFLEDDAEASLSAPAAGTFQPGEVRDGFRIVRKIGEGGMGEVYEAEQLSPIRRRLALKVLRPTRHDAHSQARFEAERQILASLSHRNVARVYAAGDVAGRPYLAMELVEGPPITDYCDRKALSIEARLALFVAVCRGVQHAHQRGIIHRDLKPSNVLVAEQDGEPVPKVIDFGISKATTEDLYQPTEPGLWLGTPDYMSPEQAAGRAAGVDTRSDVYSLGALLYELLGGCLPFDTAALRRQGLDVLLRTLREEPPPRLSRRSSEAVPATADPEARAAARGLTPAALARRLAGDLDLVVAKALEKDIERRYASPADLADDLLRHLEHRPVRAAGESTAYALRKLLRRHRLAVITAVTIVLSLLAGIVGTSAGLLRAREAEREAVLQAEQAQREAATANKIATFMWEVFRAADPGTLTLDENLTLRQVLDRGADRVRRELHDEPRVQARLMAAIGKSYVSLGLFPQGQALLEEAVETLEKVAPGSPELATASHQLADTEIELGHYDRSLVLLRRALAIRLQTVGERHDEVVAAYYDIGRVLSARGELDASIEMMEEALALARELHGDEDRAVARTLNSLGLRLLDAGRAEEGVPMLERSLELEERILGPDHPELAPVLNNLAKAAWERGDLQTAERLLLRALAIEEQVYGSEHPNLGYSWINLAFVAWDDGHDCPRTLERARRALAIFERHFAEDHPMVVAVGHELETFEAGCRDR